MMGLGRRQRNMLIKMRLYGNGQWPQHWNSMRAEDQMVMFTLQTKGLISKSGTLTHLGVRAAKPLAESITPQRARELAIENENWSKTI